MTAGFADFILATAALAAITIEAVAWLLHKPKE